jgi:anti-sigma factor RsiW
MTDMPHQPCSPQCNEVVSLLSQYLDVELPAEACHTIEEHLSECAPCVEFARSLRKTVELCRSYQPAAMPGPISKAAREELMAAYRKMLGARGAGAS